MAVSVFIVHNGVDPLMQIGELTRSFDLEWDDTIEMIKEMHESTKVLAQGKDWILVQTRQEQILKYVKT